MTPIATVSVSAIKVKIAAPMKWPISGTKPQTKMMMPIAIGDGSPSANPKRVMKSAARNEIRIWLPTKAPTRAMMASVRDATRGLRLAGTNFKPSSVACGKDVMK